MRVKFVVKIVEEDDKTEYHPMKDWLTNNPNDVPSYIDPSKNTSHEISNALKKQGWWEEQTETEVILTKQAQATTIDSKAIEEKPRHIVAITIITKSDCWEHGSLLCLLPTFASWLERHAYYQKCTWY